MYPRRHLLRAESTRAFASAGPAAREEDSLTSNGEFVNAKWGSVLLLLELSHPRWHAGAAQ
jgi:hypothetical protein